MSDYFTNQQTPAEPPLPGEEPATGNAVAGTDAHADDVGELVRRIEALRTESKATLDRADDVETLVSQLGEIIFGKPEGGPWCWRYLDPYETVALFVQVRDWVDWMVARYQVHRDVLPCWYLHGPAIEELTALYVAWRATYKVEPEPYSDTPIAFHDRWLWPCIARMSRLKFFNGCNPGQHKDPDETYLRTTDPERFTEAMTQLGDGVTPGADADQVHAAIVAGEAIPLRNHTKDPQTPVRWRGTWWAILANSPDGLWVPRPAHVCEKFEDLLKRSTTPATASR